MKLKSHKSVVSIVGARPQFIKLATLAPKLSKRFDHKIIHTGQHYDARMSSLFFKQLNIPSADINLKIGSGSHGIMTGKMLVALEKLFLGNRPDMVIVYGDTNSTLAGALAAAKLTIAVVHVEAGLRSFDNSMPEEINRRVTDQLSQLLFCPTRQSIKNLSKEGIKRGVVNSGDLMYELIHDNKAAIGANRKLLGKYALDAKKYLYVTAHRAATVDSEEKLGLLVDLLRNIGKTVLFPVHPRTLKRLNEFKLLSSLSKLSHVKMVEPLGYLDSLSAAAFAEFVLTDSGGLQKEALFLGTPVLTLREQTEWTETVGKGNRLVGLDNKKIIRALTNTPKVKKPEWKIGGKRPSDIILSAMAAYFKSKNNSEIS